MGQNAVLGNQSGKQSGDSVFRVRNDAARVRNEKAALSALPTVHDHEGTPRTVTS